jgi:hypothetical protein
MFRDVVDALVEEELGEMIDKEEVVEALETLLPRRAILLGPGESGIGEPLRLSRKRDLADDGPAVIPTVVSIASRECIP